MAKTKTKKYYYDIAEDLRKYPDCWAYAAWSGRGTGKTYSALWYMINTGAKFVFIRRTIEDVKLILAGSGKVGSKLSQYGADFNPFKAVNRDKGCNIRAFDIYKGYIGGFWACNDNGEAEGAPIGFITALSAIAKTKGFDLSECDYIIFDEFIPNPWETVDRGEGKQLLDLYMTVLRDREHRGRPPVKLLMFANPTEVNCPIFQELEVADIAAQMDVKKEEYNVTRGIMLHRIQMRSDFIEKQKSSAILQAMQGTAWAENALGVSFSYNDMSNIGKRPLKGMQCQCRVKYRSVDWYIYRGRGETYVTKSAGTHYDAYYNLNKEVDRRAFYINEQIDIKDDFTNGEVYFETYTMFDVIINFKKFFKIS